MKLKPLKVPLSKREIDVCTGLAQGLTDGELAFRLGISIGCVREYFKRASRKMNVSRRLDIALRFHCLACPHFREHDGLKPGSKL